MKDNRKNLIVSYYITLNCNLCCPYCIVYDNNEKRDLRNDLFSFSNFLNKLSKCNRKIFNFNKIFIEFFGGEPLLERKYICKLLETIDASFRYTITTNGLFWDDFVECIYHKMDSINISVHVGSINKIRLLVNKWVEFRNKISFTLVIDKYSIEKYFELIDILFTFGFKKLNILPVFLKYNRHDNDLNKLFKLVKYINDFNYFYVNFLYYNPIKKDYEFSILPDGDIYGFNGEIIYYKSLADNFFLGNINYLKNIDDFVKLYNKIKQFKDYNASLSLKDNAKMWIKILEDERKGFKQDISNYIKVNKFLMILEKYFGKGK